MEQLNTFAKGFVGDIDYQFVGNQQLVFPSLNIRLTNDANKGFIPTTLKGNKLIETFTDNINGLRINGAVEYNGVLYIAFTKLSEGGSPSGIGCYPSPDQISYNETSGLWEYDSSKSGFSDPKKFSPLMNYYFAGNRYALMTASGFGLNFDINEHVKMIAKPSYDGSVDLYIISKDNPNRVINTGFNQGGNHTDRVITTSMWDGELDLILLMKKQPKLEFSKLDKNGNLKPGKYYFFIRYLTDSFNRTDFSRQSKGIPIGSGDVNWIDSGIQEKNWYDNKEQNSDKSIELEINEINQDFTYFEIGVVRFSSLEENKDAEADIYLIDKYYSISNVVANGNKVVITGNEGQQILTTSEIKQIQNNYYRCNTQTEINDRYIGGNWDNYYNEEYESLTKTYASYCEPNTSDQAQQSEKPFSDLYSYSGPNYHYNIVDAIVNDIAYFPYEVYGFGMYITFKNGYKTKIYPLFGDDNANRELSKGLIQISGENPKQRKYVQITFADIDTHLSAIKAEIDGVFIVRTKRLGNFLYSGIIAPVSDHTVYVNSASEYVNVYYGGSDANTASKIPIISVGHQEIPVGYEEEDLPTDEGYVYSIMPGERLLSTFALFSPDFMLGERGKFINGSKLYIKQIQSISIHSNAYIDDIVYDNMKPERIGYDVNLSNLDEPITGLFNASAYAYEIEQLVFKGVENFSSYLADGENDQDNKGFLYDQEILGDSVTVYNRSYKTLPYIGLKLENPINEAQNAQWSKSLVMVFKDNPDDILDIVYNSFTIESETYIDIGEKLETSRLDVGSTNIVYADGDCYFQKTFWRAVNQFGYDQNGDVDSLGNLTHIAQIGEIIYNHAKMLCFWSFNKNNAQLRNDTISVGEEGSQTNYTWFPYVKRKEGFHGWFAWGLDSDNLFESRQINNGYMKSPEEFGRLGFNMYELNNNTYPNRVFLSAKQESGSYIDNYRNIDRLAYKDFNVAEGPIISLQNYMGKVFVVQENAIIEIFVSEEKIQQSESGQFIIATAEDLLSDKFITKAEYGAQAEKAIVKTQTGVYGVDEKRAILWKVGYQSSDNGQYIAVENYGEKIGIQHELDKALLNYPETIDIVTKREQEFDGNISAGYDPDQKEIHFTFKYDTDIHLYLNNHYYSIVGNGLNNIYYFIESHGFKQPKIKATPLYDYEVEVLNAQSNPSYLTIVDENRIFISIDVTVQEVEFEIIALNVLINKTIILSEKYGGAMGLRSYYPQSYFALEKTMITQYDAGTGYGIYFHNIGRHNYFYGEYVKSTLGFIVNGSVGENENYSAIDKIFESLAVRSKHKPLEAIFMTDDLYSHYDYSSSEIGLKPQIWKDEWLSPIPPTIIRHKDLLFVNRQMEGRYLKVLLGFKSVDESDNYVGINHVSIVRTKFNM